MQTLNVVLGERSYPILIGARLLRSPPQISARIPGRDLLLVSNTSVAPLYLARLKLALADRRCVEVILPDGEQYKTLEYASRVLDVMVASRLSRSVAWPATPNCCLPCSSN